jgi:hypothetical protein
MMATQVISNSGAFFDPRLSLLPLSYCGFPDFIVARDSYGYVVSNSGAFFDTHLSSLPALLLWISRFHHCKKFLGLCRQVLIHATSF